MSDTRYFVARRDLGAKGQGKRYLGMAVLTLRRHLRKQAHPQYHFEGEKKEWSLPAITKVAKQRIADHKPGLRLTIHGSRYDEPGYTIFARDVSTPGSAMCDALRPFVGRSSYSLGASGPPGPSDCSGATAYAARVVYDITLPHSAHLQADDNRLRHIAVGDEQAGDFCFFVYPGRPDLPSGVISHVELVDVKGHRNIGSRPSTNGVNYYNWQGSSTPDSYFHHFARLEVA